MVWASPEIDLCKKVFTADSFLIRNPAELQPNNSFKSPSPTNLERTCWRGVNLGGWLVSEKWMAPDLFALVPSADDERSLLAEGGSEARDAVAKFRETFITQEANEIVQTSMSSDCQGKKGNVGFKVVTRAVSKSAETIEEEEDDPSAQGVSQDKQAELADVVATSCTFDITEIAQVWWTDVSTFKKENLKAEDARVKSLVKRLSVEDEDPVVGSVAHSILFKRMMQLFWPKDRLRQEEIRTASRNGAAQDTVDPYEDKVMNCGTSVSTFRYHSGGAEIVKAVFLFDGHMESALACDRQTQDPDDVDIQEDNDPSPHSPHSPELL